MMIAMVLRKSDSKELPDQLEFPAPTTFLIPTSFERSSECAGRDSHNLSMR
jgi:hypothetical protein